MTEEDDYPPYAPERQFVRPELTPKQFSRVVVIICGVVAGLAIGGLLVAYGVF